MLPGGFRTKSKQPFTKTNSWAVNLSGPYWRIRTGYGTNQILSKLYKLLGECNLKEFFKYHK